MFLLLMISIGLACTIKNQHLQFLYPTEQENYKLDMSELFDGENLFFICTIGDDISIRDFKNIQRCDLSENGIEIKNVITEVNYTPKLKNQIKNTNSVSGYQNYISTIQNNQLINTYEINYTSNSITYLNSSKIGVNFDCQSYSSTFASSSNVITDCYNNNNFQLLLFIQNVPIVIFELQKAGYNTSLISYTNLVYINNYIIYAIYLNNQESYLHNYYYNETTQQAKFISRFNILSFTDFSLMADGNSIAILNLTNCIFISNIEDLNNYNNISIPQDQNNGQFLALKSFPSFQYGQIITSFIIVNDNYYDNIFEFQYNGSNLSIQHVYESYQLFTMSSIDPVKIYISTSFLIIQQNDQQTYFYIGKYSNSHEYQAISQIYQNKDFEDSVQLYLNYEDNKLLKFSQRLSMHHLSKPKLIIEINNQSQSGQITIFAYENPEVHDDIFFFGCNITLSYQLLSQSNYSILNTTNISKFSTIQDLQEIFYLNDHFTGPLMQLIVYYNQSNNPNISLSTPQNQVFKYLNDNLPGLQQNQTQVYFVEKYSLLFYAWISTNNYTNIFYTICGIGDEILNCTTSQTNYSIKCNVNEVTSIQMSQLNQTELVLVFDQSQNILVYSISFEPKQFGINITITNPILLYNYTIENQNSILQFQILYNKLIVLYNNSEIIVNYYNYKTSYYINQSAINQVGGQYYDIEFQPISIQVNQQLYQSTLFINNQNSFIILELFNTSKQNNNFSILSYQSTTYNISQIVVVQMYIILASITNYPLNNVSFFVYDISIINQPHFYKPLPNCTIQSNWQIIADNYFFYVRQIDYSIFIYSIDLPYHSALYYNLTLSQYESISCTNTKQFSILSMKNNLYSAFQNTPYSFQFYQIKQQDKMLSSVNLQTNILNPWNNKFFTYELIVVNIYLQISMNITQYKNNQNPKQLTFYTKKGSSDQVLLPLNMTNVSMGQVMNYYIIATQNNQEIKNQSFNITNQFITENQYFTNGIKNITQMTSFCRSLFYQNITGLYQSSYVIFDGLLVMNYSQYNFTECLSLSVTINGPSIYMNSICKQDNNIIVFSLFPNSTYINSTNSTNSINSTNSTKSTNSTNSTNSIIDTNYTCSPSQPWNQSHLNYLIINPPYNSIIKSSQLTHYLFILGKMGQNDNSQQIYIYDLNKTNGTTDQNISLIRRIQCRGGISDYNFTILQNKSLINSTYSGRGVIFYLCQNPSELKYVSFNITNTTNITFSKISNRVSDVITQYVNRSDSKFLQIFIYLVKYDQIILVLTSNNVYNLVIIMSYSPLSYAQTSLQFEDVIAYIPPYGNYTQIPLGVLQDSFLALLFRSPVSYKAQHIVAMYNISKIRQTYNLSNQLNYNSTIQMEGGYYFNESFGNILQIALVNQTNNISQFLLVLSNDNENLNQTNVTLLVFNQSIYFQCTNVSQLYKKDYDYYLVASNSFYNYNISISITPEQLSSPVWAGILLALTIIICAFLVIEFWKKIKMQNLELNKSKELLEIEM